MSTCNRLELQNTRISTDYAQKPPPSLDGTLFPQARTSQLKGGDYGAQSHINRQVA